ncbi:nuclease-related domain-containing protein [Phytoactinopolyspora mesophila]|uniref:NERD domain-containing protein n=1 Tax=Phytoactinopolyspora mesophila TaxID=2650750 RepID=A0A7K3MCF8_9ACTN|nr:nuclease-related domain-containing protein [Phytoactinopolyspora mesophila]NDL60078.1 hypothetical protein [Phytoactinopolyspora mesophila]
MLFEQTPFKDGYRPQVMEPGWAKELLGSTVAEWVSIGFCLLSAAKDNIKYPFEWTPTTAQLLDTLGGAERFDEVVRRSFTADIGTLKTKRRREVERYGDTPGERYVREPFAYNPLHTYPLVGGVADGFLAPCMPLIEMRTSALGIVYEGLEKWSTQFTNDTGNLFEQYVGMHLKLVEGAQLYPEIQHVQRKQHLHSVDWLLVMPKVVVIVECKSMMPDRAIHEGATDFMDSHVRRLNKPINQINRTAAAITSRIQEFTRIPSDRPIVGLIVTLGTFDMANSPIVRGELAAADVPTAIIGVDELEQLVMTETTGLDAFMAEVANHQAAPGVVDLTGWPKITTRGANPILNAAFDALPAITKVQQWREARAREPGP